MGLGLEALNAALSCAEAWNRPVGAWSVLFKVQKVESLNILEPSSTISHEFVIFKLVNVHDVFLHHINSLGKNSSCKYELIDTYTNHYIYTIYI